LSFARLRENGCNVDSAVGSLAAALGKGCGGLDVGEIGV